MRGRVLALALSALAVASGACTREPAVDLRVPTRQYKAKEYPRVLKRWTRHRRIIKNFDTNLSVHVTYLSPEFVTAHAALYAKFYRLSRAERQRYLAKRLAEVRSHHEFFMGVTTADPTWNDFDRRSSIWRITLEDDKGTRVKPLTVKNITIKETHRTYFPYLSVFHRAYHVIFPKQVGGRPFITPQSRWFKLIIASPLGSTELAWFVRSRGRPDRGKTPPRAEPRPEPRPEPAGRSDAPAPRREATPPRRPADAPASR